MTDSKTLAYQPALDGLRAVAVLSVMLYHGGVAWAGGGFLGVDLFFVLSGFLITTLLFLEFEARGALDLKDFWARRARRLLPALFLVLVAVLVYAAFLAGEAAAAIRRDTLATLFYVSNWWFIASDNSYFQQFADPSPLTHTWSLAIEEQWYLLLPLVLVLLLPRVRSRRLWAVGFGVLALASAILMMLLASGGSDPSRAYYGTDTRLQALLVGAVLAALFTPGVLDRIRRPAAFLAPVALLVLLAFVVLVEDTDAWMYRGGFLLVALVAGLLLVSLLARPRSWLASALSIAPLVWVGRISYGLYLWHWPVYVVLSPARTGMSGLGLLAVRFAVTFLIAAASFYLVEMPIRSGALARLSIGQRWTVALGAPLGVLALMGATAAAARPPAPDSLEALQQVATPSPSRSLEPTTEQTRAVLVGDSVALSLYAAYLPEIQRGLTVAPGSEFGCGVVPFETSVNGVRYPVTAQCQQWQEQRADRIANTGANLGVLFAGPWEQYDRWIDGPVPYTDPKWREATVAGYVTVLNELAENTDHQAVVLNTCHGAPDLDLPDAVLYQAGRVPGVINDPDRAAAVNDTVKEAVRRSGVDATVIDPNPFLCQDGYQAQLDGVPLHTDGVHFTEEGARLYWQWLAPRLVKAGR